MQAAKTIGMITLILASVAILPITTSKAGSDGVSSDILIIDNQNEGLELLALKSETCSQCMARESARCDQMKAFGNRHRAELCKKDLRENPDKHCRKSCEHRS